MYNFISVLMSPFMPETSEKIFEQINCDIKSYESLEAFGALKENNTVGEATPLFARIDAEKVLAEIAAEQGMKKVRIRRLLKELYRTYLQLCRN